MTKLIPIFSAEKEDGTSEKIRSQSSIAYFSELSQSDQQVQINDLKLPKSVATNLGQEDLFYLEAILVTTCGNLNDDVFVGSELWAAKTTPEDKPINVGHVDQDIVGHMTAVRAINDEGKTISDSTPVDQLPKKFHLATSGVLYKIWSDEDQQERIDDIIDGISSGKQFVSMECMFHNFDYLVKEIDGTEKIVARDSSTAFLSKHLRAYGGSGTYDGKKVQRVLRNIAFIGKGIVEKPANPESVFLNNVIVADVKETESMPNTDTSQQVTDLKAELGVAKAAAKDAEASLQKQIDEAVKVKVEKLEATISGRDDSIAGLKDEVKVAAKSLSDANDELAEAKTKMDEQKAELEKIEAEAKRVSRVSDLVKSGKTEEEAVELVENFKDLSDESFAGVLKLIPAKAVEGVEDDKEGEATADEVNLDDKSDDEADLTASTNGGDEVRASLSDFISDNFGLKREKEEVA